MQSVFKFSDTAAMIAAIKSMVPALSDALLSSLSQSQLTMMSTDLAAAKDLTVPDPASAPARKAWQSPALMSDTSPLHPLSADRAAADARRYAEKRNKESARRQERRSA